MNNIETLHNSLKAISPEIGILRYVAKLPRMSLDPRMVGFGIGATDTEFLSGEKYAGRSSGAGFSWDDALLGTIGETVERYAPCFYNKKEGIPSTYKDLKQLAIPPKEFALFHEKQIENEKFKLKAFTEDTKLIWFPTTDITNGKETYVPGQFIYMPFTEVDGNYVTNNTSTGLAAHTDYYKAILTGLYEAIERDSFVITWMQKIAPKKIIITKEIDDFINKNFPVRYEWHFFDMTYDLDVPTIMAVCIGETEFGKFLTISSSSRSTYGQALIKVVQEVGQSVPYFRFLLEDRKNWNPADDFLNIRSFDDHSILYTKRPDLWFVFDPWIQQKETKKITLYESIPRNDKEEIIKIAKTFKALNYNLLIKDITTCDIRQLGFFSIKVFVPQLIPLSGIFPYYFSGGERLYSVPKKMGYTAYDYEHLNQYPHPFP